MDTDNSTSRRGRKRNNSQTMTRNQRRRIHERQMTGTISQQTYPIYRDSNQETRAEICRNNRKRRMSIITEKNQRRRIREANISKRETTSKNATPISATVALPQIDGEVVMEMDQGQTSQKPDNREQSTTSNKANQVSGSVTIKTTKGRLKTKRNQGQRLQVSYSSKKTASPRQAKDVPPTVERTQPEGRSDFELAGGGTTEKNEARTIQTPSNTEQATTSHQANDVSSAVKNKKDKGILMTKEIQSQGVSTFCIGESSTSTQRPKQVSRVDKRLHQEGRTYTKADYLYLGDPIHTCPYCDAIMWFDESVKKSSKTDIIKFNMCCREGNVCLPKLMDPPEFLNKLLTDTTDKDAATFRQLIRMYNSCYAFTSMGAKIDRSVNTGQGKYCFRISGQVLHRIGSLLPEDEKDPSYAQLYVYDTTSELMMREKAVGTQEGSPKLNEDILTNLKNMLDEVNPLAHTFRMAQERLREDDDAKISIRLLGTRKQNDRTYNAPTASEIAALIVDPIWGNTNGGRDIIIEHKSQGLRQISELHPSFMALQYPLLFPYGEDSYYIDIPYYIDPEQGYKGKRETVTMREYYAYRIQQRTSEGLTLLRGGRLFQQFLVDCWCAIESERLWWVRNNQQLFRCDVLNNLCDAVLKGDSLGSSVGKRFYLPASFTGGPRYMYQNYQDAMALCRWYGNPHLFITFTANAKWPEVEKMLDKIKDQKADDRPDVIARVFKLKLKQLMNCLKKDQYFGVPIADVYTIEFQKRGMPHAHILLWLKKDKDEVTTEYIDSIIHAEIPDKDVQPDLYETVSRCMVHGPCGMANPKCACMINNTCSKKYPKEFNMETTLDKNGYPVYRRRENDRVIKKGEHTLDNRSVVPYNPGLLMMFDAHINVEWCNTARAIKYLFKYISKGPDKATLVIKDDVEDEIKSYLDCRYLSASEAAWRILEFPIHERYPAVIHLTVHLEGEQAVVMKDDDKLKVAIHKASQAQTMLTAWMQENEVSPAARLLTYAEFPTKYVWDKGWHIRKKGMCIGRIAYVHPTAGERYYLRLLLNIVKGPRSYEEIRTINGRLWTTFKDACYALGLLNNDKEWTDAMQEANQWAMPSQLRELFVTILLFCEVTDIAGMWETSWEMLSEDIQKKKRKQFRTPQLELNDAQKKTYTCIELDKILMKYGKRLKDVKNMPQPKESDVEGMGNRLLMEERMYNQQQMDTEWTTKTPLLNTDQRAVYDAVVTAVSNKEGKLFFVYGHGGTGKTFLYGTLSAKLRAGKEIVLNVASSGIAALLLPGGRTAYSRFDIPVDLFEDTTCNIRQGSHIAELLQETSLIIWDEAPMDHRFAFEALDRTLRDIMSLKDPKAASQLFGGKVVLLGGDFRQVLPIVAKGKRQDVVQASINRSYIWRSCKVFVLRTSMRVRNDQRDTDKMITNKRFNNWLLAMGDGRLEAIAENKDDEPTWVKIPGEYLHSTGKIKIQTMVDEIYPGFLNRGEDDDYLRERAILTPLNENADEINNYMIDLIPGEYRVYKSCDEVCASSMDNDDQHTAYPTEYLNSLQLQGLPRHELKLKTGMPVMLLRNINPSQGLCNGTRLIVIRTGKFVVEARIITGSKVGSRVLIPRIMMTSSDTKIPFILKRRQYPLKPCYAMTINKSQGQSLTHVGVYLPKPVFSHGQLYVAASRTTSPQGLRFFIDDSGQSLKGYTRNIVYKEVFSNLPVGD